MFNKMYTIRKSRKLMFQIYNLYRKKRKGLLEAQKEHFQYNLKSLETAIKKNDRETADKIVRKLQELSKDFLKKSPLEKVLDFIFAIIFALAIAVVVRQMWFEFYKIPSGSMRPTLKEGDFLVVSKDDFGINTLGRTGHFYYDSSLMKRGEIVIFSGENMDIEDVDTMYFWLIPGKKQYIKRLIAKGGDTVYFYGGKVYGIDYSGNEITEYSDGKWFDKNEYIPFISFDGKTKFPKPPSYGFFSPMYIYQMNEPVAKLEITDSAQVTGQLFPTEKNPRIKEYQNIWGFRNFAMTRILTNDQAKMYHNVSKNLEKEEFYLEITHNPSLSGAKVIKDEYGRLRPNFNIATSLLPLNNKHLQEIFKHIYTCRFTIKNGYGARYGVKITEDILHFLPKFKNIPNGNYEFINGIAYQVYVTGITKRLKKNHPLNNFNPEYVQKLYNLGIEFDLHFAPKDKNQTFRPSRYAYFRNSDLYLLNYPVVKKSDPLLISFLQNEYKKAADAPKYAPYSPFEDMKAPLKENGELDKEFIKKYGLRIPDKMYLVLGDNHAMSADSRYFGFVPEENIRGGASLIFWPIGSRFGRLLQPHYYIFTFPRIVIWTSAFIVLIISIYFIRRRNRKSLKF